MRTHERDTDDLTPEQAAIEAWVEDQDLATRGETYRKRKIAPQAISRNFGVATITDRFLGRKVVIRKWGK